MRRLRISALMLLAVVVLGSTESAALAQSLVTDDRIEAVAGMVVHETRCGLDVDEQAVENYVVSMFDDPAEALSALRTNIGYFTHFERDLSGLDKTVRCAAIEAFARESDLLSE